MQRIIIFDFNRTLYDPESKMLIVDTDLVLSTLQERGFELYLASRANTNNSRRKLIETLSIGKYFTSIIVTREKSVEIFRKIINQKNIAVPSSFVIGDRVREEIAFGNLLGMQTIWLQTEKFSHELPRNNNEKPDYKITRLKEALTIIK